MPREKSQRDKILDHLKTHGSITPLEALNLYGCFRLGSRIYELREMGHVIITDRSDGDKQYAVYRLIEK